MLLPCGSCGGWIFSVRRKCSNLGLAEVGEVLWILTFEELPDATAKPLRECFFQPHVFRRTLFKMAPAF
jgi:hypothetical protein